ncbi:MAG: hypothetical protein H6574_17745 [Lewinellaceae bacterium]|nr:hypothetical protein [Saprospiraceae bacterium]MCB9316824.1 hypothetical protein [Lewinellaceae bacterium]MCB9332914.1 hypothetical protein [Lewinellaceae bacterium]
MRVLQQLVVLLIVMLFTACNQESAIKKREAEQFIQASETRAMQLQEASIVYKRLYGEVVALKTALEQSAAEQKLNIPDADALLEKLIAMEIRAKDGATEAGELSSALNVSVQQMRDSTNLDIEFYEKVFKNNYEPKYQTYLKAVKELEVIVNDIQMTMTNAGIDIPEPALDLLDEPEGGAED